MTRSIQFISEVEGYGIINFDTSKQRFMLNRAGVFIETKYENFTLGKHHYYPLPEKDPARDWVTHKALLSISADCLRHYIFINGFPFQNPNVCHSQGLINMVTGSVDGQCRGYLLTEAQGITLKRTSCLMITDAEQIDGGSSNIEICTTSGAKEKKESTEDDNSGTSMHYRENIGKVTYSFEGAIDLKEAQFISCSQHYDRLAINPDHSEAVRKLLSSQLGSEVQPIKWYTVKGSVVKAPEQGILLTKDQLGVMVSYLLDKVIHFNVQKTRAYAKLKNLKFRLIDDPLVDFNKPWTTLYADGKVTMPAIDPNSFEYFYEEMTEEEAKALYAEIDIDKEKTQAKAREKNAEARKRKEAAKVKKSGKGE